ncbi:MAG: hypothetical protein EOO51_00505 [Flavobacterium sp.]|nr:MAG: hypothetical protein EOO51_00505 [Flavobacterium sp.]
MKPATLKNAAILAILGIALCGGSCKGKEESDTNDAATEATGSFKDNHTSETDTSASQTDSITSNSTQTDPAAQP